MDLIHGTARAEITFVFKLLESFHYAKKFLEGRNRKNL
jgi:hypothetical protein